MSIGTEDMRDLKAAFHAAPESDEVWSQAEWLFREERLREAILGAGDPARAWRHAVREARAVLRKYSTSFFVVTRFLPPRKRQRVELIYAAVRYPDEIVDTFPWSAGRRIETLDAWERDYHLSLGCDSLQESVRCGASPWIAAFAQVVRETSMPREHYVAFVEAMRRDADPKPFDTLDDLIDDYVYGSAVVVGYFLTYVYGSARPHDFERAMRSARSLGIALQLTNFLRDVAEDQRRGRQYIPLDLLRAEGLDCVDVKNRGAHGALRRVLQRLADTAEDFYLQASRDLDAFAPDSRTAIKACVSVYRQLNSRIAQSEDSIARRASVPMIEKLRVLPPSKYWRLPLAYIAR